MKTFCDCGQAATTRHANEQCCAECKRVVTSAQANLDEHIRKNRGGQRGGQFRVQSGNVVKRDRKEYMRQYRENNAKKILVYQKQYQQNVAA